MKVLPLSEVKMKLSQLVEEVSSLDEEITITRNGKPVAIIVSPDEFDSRKETLAIRAAARRKTEIPELRSISHKVGMRTKPQVVFSRPRAARPKMGFQRPSASAPTDFVQCLSACSAPSSGVLRFLCDVGHHDLAN